MQGSMKFLKDCDMVKAFENLPKPAEFTDLYGIHPKICCPPKGRVHSKKKNKMELLQSQAPVEGELSGNSTVRKLDIGV